tara:strand:- start:48 stop:224 length:177 start_codon:yes stop_codon:yes gene_type:complete
MQTKDTHSEIIKMQTHIRMSDRIDVLMEQSLQLMEIVNKNQTEVNRLKAKQEKLKVGV